MRQSDLDRIKAKQLTFRQLKEERILKTEEEFKEYITMLEREDLCKYMTGMSEIITLCSTRFDCKFKGETYKSFSKSPRKECLRPRITKFERMLEA